MRKEGSFPASLNLLEKLESPYFGSLFMAEFRAASDPRRNLTAWL